jgi:hypothetical protein
MMYTKPTKRYDVEETLSGQAQGLPVGVEISSAEAVILGLGTRWWWCWGSRVETRRRAELRIDELQTSATAALRSDAFHGTDVQ